MLVSGPSHGQLTLNPDGSFTYLPNLNYVGLDSFTYQASDGILRSNVATVTINVTYNGILWVPTGSPPWTVSQTGGSAGGQGSATYQNSQISMRAGDSFSVTVAQPFTVPDTLTLLAFTYSGLSFDTTHTSGMRDAFEAAFVDSSGQSLVYPIGPGRDAFFNASQGQPVSLAPGVSLVSPVTSEVALTPNDQLVLLDITQLATGTQGTVLFRLVSNDQNTQTSVQIGVRGVSSPGPRVVITGSPTTIEGASYTLGLSAGGLGTSSIDHWTINWGDGTTQTVAGNPSSVNHVYADGPSDYTVQASITDGLGTFTSNALGVSVANVPPTVTVTGPSSIAEGQTYTLHLSSVDNSVDGASDVPTGWTINWGDGTTDTLGGNPSTATHVYADGPNAYTVQASATNDDGTYSAPFLAVSVANVPPTVTLSGPATVTEGDTYTVTLHDSDTTSDSGDDAPTGWLLSWGDGTVESLPGNATSDSHVYTDGPNAYSITATLSNDDGNFNATPLPVAVLNLPPLVTVSGPSATREGQLYTLNLSSVDSSIDADDDAPMSWSINWGDGITDALSGNPDTATHVYADGPQTCTIQASATNDDGTYSASPRTVSVANLPPAVTISGPASVAEGQTYTLNLSSVDGTPDAAGDIPTGWSIDWGDGSTDTPAGNPSTATHIYADGPQNYTVQASATNDDGTFASNSLAVSVTDVAPAVTSPAGFTVSQDVGFNQDIATFTDPGFAANESFRATIDWGDGTTSPGSVTWTLGSTGTPTTGTVVGSHTYTQLGTFTATTTVTDDGGAGGSASTSETVVLSHIPKFTVVDENAHEFFRYAMAGNLVSTSALADSRPRGVASNAAGDTFWVADADHNVYVYDASGTLLGSWQATGLNQPQDITTDGTDLWIVDNATFLVSHYANAAGVRSGSLTPTDTFALSTADQNPSGIVTDGTNLWVTDEHTNPGQVFVYSLSGTLQGSWQLDPANVAPTGVTLNPAGGNDLWVVDQSTNTVFDYAQGRQWRGGAGHNATGQFPLDATNHHAEGIADPNPPTLNVSPTSAMTAAGSTYLISGQAQAGTSKVVSVTANGTPVSALDAAGDFFSPLAVKPGVNAVTLTATDSAGLTASTPVNITGTQPATGAIDFSRLADVTGSITPQYGRTSYDAGTGVLYVDLSVTNRGQYGMGTPLLVEVQHLSQPTVRLWQPTGETPAGMPYEDLSGQVVGTSLAPGQTSQVGTLAFYDPQGLPFTYDLTFLAPVNRPPAFTSAPVVQVPAGSFYQYTAQAADPDGDVLTYALLDGPAGMALNPATGQITWIPGVTGAGTYRVALGASDGRGGSAEQDYVISVTNVSDRPPVFTSTPVVDAWANSPYVYVATASDPDNDPLAFSLVSGPTGLAIDRTTGVVSWTPSAGQVGNQSVTLQVADGRGATATQTYAVAVHAQSGDRPPLIVSTPVTAVGLGLGYQYAARALDPDGDPITYSLSTAPAGMAINATSGLITWTPTATGSYAVTVKADDGRGGTDTQSYTVAVTSANASGLASIYGSKFDDLNGDGVRGSTDTPAGQLGTIALYGIGITDTMLALDYDPLLGSLLAAVTPAGGGNTKLVSISAGGQEKLLAQLGLALTDGIQMAIAQPANIGGFIPGDVFLPASVPLRDSSGNIIIHPPAGTSAPPASILRVSDGGATVQSPGSPCRPAPGQ